jgi:hypothetical protein
VTSALPKRGLDTRVRRIRGRQYIARGSDAFELNEVAEVVWGLCDGRTPLSTIVDRVTDTYDVDRSRARGDIEALLAELGELGFLDSPAEEPAPLARRDERGKEVSP